MEMRGIDGEGRKANEDNLLWFLQDLLKRVVEVYEEKNLPHYFLPQMNFFETFPVEKRDALLKTVEIAKKFNSKDFLITMVKKSSQIFKVSIQIGKTAFISIYSSVRMLYPVLAMTYVKFLADNSYVKTARIRRIGPLIFWESCTPCFYIKFTFKCIFHPIS